MASVIRGDDNFDSSGVGAATDFGDVGSYAFCLGVILGFTENSTIAGSSLLPSGLNSNAYTSDATDAASTTKGGSALSGTWRAMGRQYYGPTSNRGRQTLFVRIS